MEEPNLKIPLHVHKVSGCKCKLPDISGCRKVLDLKLAVLDMNNPLYIFRVLFVYKLIHQFQELLLDLSLHEIIDVLVFHTDQLIH